MPHIKQSRTWDVYADEEPDALLLGTVYEVGEDAFSAVPNGGTPIATFRDLEEAVDALALGPDIG